jgi:hypothetical protein
MERIKMELKKQTKFAFWDAIAMRLEEDTTATQRLALFCLIGKNTYKDYMAQPEYTYKELTMCFNFVLAGDVVLWRTLAYGIPDPSEENYHLTWKWVTEVCPQLAGVV